ncbi:MAG: nitroreductase [Chloroflexi bacterium]|nr:nitroreductase [Chloroflexota bacterium]MDA1002561.1 nitroreductase [Chloroflexota bacterium]
MDLIEGLATRRSASAFASGCPPREEIARLIEAATWAPNHHLTQPWRFEVLAGEERARFGEHLAAAIVQDADASERAPRLAESTRTKLLRSPVLVVVIQRGDDADPERTLEDYAACCCATQNLLLAAHAEGLAAKWSTGAMATMVAAREYFALAPDDRIVAYVYVGYPLEDAKLRLPERAPAVVSFRGFED